MSTSIKPSGQKELDHMHIKDHTTLFSQYVCDVLAGMNTIERKWTDILKSLTSFKTTKYT